MARKRYTAGGGICRRALLTAFLVVVAGGCDGLTGTDTPTIAGTWLAERGGEQWRMELSDPGTGVIFGTYLITVPSFGSVSLSGPVAGRYDYPNVSLDFEIVIDWSISCAIRGTMAASGQSIASTLTCSSSGSDALDFRRSP